MREKKEPLTPEEKEKRKQEKAQEKKFLKSFEALIEKARARGALIEHIEGKNEGKE